MEEILIKDIDKKDSGLVIVKYNGNREATLNTKWQGTEVGYLEHAVGVGGRVTVMIQKKGEYTNITKVDMTSGVKGSGDPDQPSPTQASGSVDLAPQEAEGGIANMGLRNNSIIAQTIMKGAVELAKKCDGQELNELANELLGVYRVTFEALNNQK